MFKTATRWERPAHIIPERRTKLQAVREFLAQLGSDLTLAENKPEIAAVAEELQNGGFLAEKAEEASEGTHGPSRITTLALCQPTRLCHPGGAQCAPE